VRHDTDSPEETVEEREHGVFVPPDEQHVREDGTPTEPAESAERPEQNSDVRDAEIHDADRVDAVGTEAVPHAMETDKDADRDTEPTLVDPEPATPLDTGTAEDAERAEEMPAEQVRAEDDTEPAERVEDIGAEDETHAVDVDGRNANADNIDTNNIDTNNVDGQPVDVDAVDVDAVDIDNADSMDADADADAVAVGTATVPQQSTAPAAEFWPTGLVDDLRGRWDTVQMRFVDDPSGVATDAKALVGEAVSAIRDAVDRLEARLQDAAAEASDDTEQLRQRVAHYRDVFESLLSR